MTELPRHYDADTLRRMTDATLGDYDRTAREFWAGTRNHDVSQNRATLIDAIEGDPPYSILYADELHYTVPASEEAEVWRMFEAQRNHMKAEMLDNYELIADEEYGVCEEALARLRRSRVSIPTPATAFD